MMIFGAGVVLPGSANLVKYIPAKTRESMPPAELEASLVETWAKLKVRYVRHLTARDHPPPARADTRN
jgi:hypothetical protein